MNIKRYIVTKYISLANMDMDTHKSDTDTDIGGNHPLRRDPCPDHPPCDSHNGTHGTQQLL